MQIGGSHGDIKAEASRHANAVEENGNCRKMEEFDRMNCVANCQDSTFCVDEAAQPKKANGLASGDSQTDIFDCGHDLIDEDMDTDSTEYSSSVEDFSDYEDGPENDSSSTRMEAELDELPGIFVGWNRVSRKKKMTEHWRKYIQPLMWRCRWIELRVRELHNQVAKYDRELLGYCSGKSEEPNWPHGQHAAWNEEAAGDSRGKMYTRKKRKRIEDMVDVQSYVSEHAIFSYFDNRPEADDLAVDEGIGNQAELGTGSHDDIALSFEWPNLEIKGNDKFLEQILLDIESAQVRVLAMKSRLGKMIPENNSDFYTPGVFIPGDPNYRPSLSPRCSPVNNGCAAPVEATGTSPYEPEFDNEEFALSGSAVSSYGDASHPDIIECTAGLLASASDLLPNQLGNLGTDVADGILICNQAAEEDLHDFENIHHPQLRHLGDDKAAEEENAFAHRVSSSETETDPDIAPAMERKPTMKRCGVAADFLLRRSNRKRKLKKASPGGWNGGKMRRRNKTRKQGPS